jgi:hypothetical protein
MRWLSRLLIVLILCLMATALQTVPSQAICVPWYIEVNPESGVPGTELTVSGYDFTEDTPVDIYYDGDLIAIGETSSGGDFTITFTVPEGCSGHYQVLADLGYTTSDAYFTVKPGLTINPENGLVGTTVTVTGQGFAKNEEDIELLYYLSGDYETVERNIKASSKGSWETSFPIPISTKGEHKIDAEGAESRLFEVEDAIFRVTAEISMDKSAGIVGDTITVTGSRFAIHEKNIKIFFDGQEVVTDIKANAEGDWEASFDVPEMPEGNYSITAEGEWTKKEDISELSFEIKPDIVLSPDEGYVGIDLMVTGSGFAASTDVDIMYDGSNVTTAKTNDKGSFETSFPVPESQHGERVVAAGYDGENHANSIFTMESDPPDTPKLISPSSGSRFGFIGNAMPTFEWSAVSDDSGVRYSLQIATSDNFTASSIIASVTGLTETNYALEEKDALPNGTYYWRVQAVDGAENESGWTVARSFRAGFLPLWGFIAAAVAILVLFIAMIRALVIRRKYYY